MLDLNKLNKGDRIAVNLKEYPGLLSWERATVVEVVPGGVRVRRNIDHASGVLIPREVLGRWVLDTGVTKLTGKQDLVLRRLRMGPASDIAIAIYIDSSCASARSRVAELRRMGYRISVEKGTRTYTLGEKHVP